MTNTKIFIVQRKLLRTIMKLEPASPQCLRLYFMDIKVYIIGVYIKFMFLFIG